MNPVLELGDRQSFAGLPENLLIISYLISLATILIYIRSLIYFDTNPLTFHIAFVTTLLTLSLLLVGSKRCSVGQLGSALVLAWVLTLGLMIPLRLQEGIVSNYPDMIYELQIVRGLINRGSVTYTAPTVFAAGYAFHPVLEVLVVMTSLVLGIDSEIVLKYAGPFMGVLTIAFLLAFYRSFLSKKASIISLFLAASCFQFLSFDPNTVHESLALPFLFALVYTLTKRGRPWRAIGTLFACMVVLTHAFTSIVVSVLFLAASAAVFFLSRILRGTPGHLERLTQKIAVSFAVITCLWLLWFASPLTSGQIGSFFKYVIRLLLSEGQTRFPLTGSSTVYLWTRITGDVGIVLFALTALIGFILAMRKQYSQYRPILPFAFGAGVIFVVLALPFARVTRSIDLLLRAFTYVYFFAAPLSYITITKLASTVRIRFNFRTIAAILLISLIASAGVYYNRAVFLYDSSAPMNVEDVRFPLQEWKSAGFFAKIHVSESADLWGDKIAFNFVGGFGEREVNFELLPTNQTLTDLVYVDASRGRIVILRQSMVDVPYYSTSIQEFGRILQGNNVLYSSGEVIMIEVT